MPPSLPQGAARPEPLGDAVREHVDDLALGEVSRRERLVLSPVALCDFAHGRPLYEAVARVAVEGLLTVPG